MPTLTDLLQALTDARADSLQLRAEQPPALLVERKPVPLPGPPLTLGEIDALVQSLVEATARPDFEARGLYDGTFDAGRAGRFAYRIRRLPDGTALAFRPVGSDASAGPAGQISGAGAGGGWPTHNIHALLVAAWNRGASDVIFSGNAQASVRFAGELITLTQAAFSDDTILASLGPTLTADRRRTLDESGSLDCAVEVSDGDRAHRFRVNVFRQMGGLAAAWRPVWERVPEPSALHLPPDLVSMTDFPYGLILVVGPTGAGKSTTLAVLLEHINRTQAKHVITLEDPVEHLFRSQRSLVHQREVGVHVSGFSEGLRAALRECPDVILVGEMRDLDTIAATLTAAETGHLVLSTLHSGSAMQAIDRVIDVFPQHQQAQVRIQLSEVLRGVITQRLLPTADGKGRVPVLEIVRMNYAFSNLIREKKTHLFASQIQTTQREGNLPFDVSLSRAVKEGLISIETAIRASHDPQHLRTLIGASSAPA